MKAGLGFIWTFLTCSFHKRLNVKCHTVGVGEGGGGGGSEKCQKSVAYYLNGGPLHYSREVKPQLSSENGLCIDSGTDCITDLVKLP